eukprot:11125232-Alexandrium_andersonii.AAC.1
MLWLVEHAGELLMKPLVGHDGRAAFERLFGKPSRGDGYEFGEQVRFRARPDDMDRGLNPRWEPGIWLGRRWGSASHIVAVSATEVRSVRAVARCPLSERWSREAQQGLVSAPWVWRAESTSADGGPPQVIPRVPQETAAPPPRPPVERAPRRVNVAKSMLEEHGYAAGCLKCSRVREQRFAAGTRRSEERCSRFEGLLRAAGDASMARADERTTERFAREVQSRVEAAAAVAPRLEAASSSGGGPAPAQVASARREQGEQSGQAEPAFAGARPASDEVESHYA